MDSFVITPEQESRYDRQALIDWWDQTRLKAARVLVAGAGALGNEVLKNLAVVGVGNITVQTAHSWFSGTWCLDFLPPEAILLENPLSLVFKVRCLSATGFLKWLITLATTRKDTTYGGICQCQNQKYILLSE